MNTLAQVSIGDKFFGGGSKFQSLGAVGSLVTLFLNISFVLAGVILLIYFIMGGIGMIAGAGSQNPQQIEKGKQAATSALIGFVVVFVSYWIVKLIEQITGVSILGQ